ncbi:hypothetical protein [Cupriavidus necator]
MRINVAVNKVLKHGKVIDALRRQGQSEAAFGRSLVAPLLQQECRAERRIFPVGFYLESKHMQRQQWPGGRIQGGEQRNGEGR